MTRRTFLSVAGRTAAALSLGEALTYRFGGGARAQDFFLPPSLLVTPAELSERLTPALSGCPSAIGLLHEQFRLIDARALPAYLEGHALTAVGLEAETLNETRNGVALLLAPVEEVAERLGSVGLDRDLEAILYSDDGNLWAARLYWILDHLGHTNARILDGGSAQWARDASMNASGEPTASPDARTFQVVFVDARLGEAFDRGHLPGAVNLPWRGNIDWDSEAFLPIGELATRFSAAGVTPDRTVISYCQFGVLSAHNYFAMRLLGYPDVRLYDGSWADWITDENRPVETGS
jgi:thiosulfate/3-mercaptopyruvate sulfurtransferase